MSQQTMSQETAVLKGLLRRLVVDEAYEEARAVGGRLVEIVPDDGEIWYLCGRVKARLGELDDAVECLGRALDIAGPMLPIAVEMVYIDGMRGDLPGAIVWCKRGLELDPTNPDLHRELARLHAFRGETDEAVRVLEICLRMPGLEPEDVKATREELAQILMRLRRFDDALFHLRSIAESDEADDSVWTNIGHCLSRKGQTWEALEAFERAVKIRPDAPNHYDLGDAYLAEGQPDKAVEPLKEAIRIDPDHALARYDLGLAFYELGRFEEAVAESRAAIAADPDLLTPELNLGLSAMTNIGLGLMSQEKYEEAILCFKKNEKKFASTYFNMGLALFRADRNKEALDYFKRACAIEPDDAEFLNLLGQTCDRLGMYREGEKHLRRSIELAPDYADSHYDLGNMFLKIEAKRPEAKTLLERAIELEPADFWAHYCMGCWYALDGKKTQAFEWLEKAIEKGFKDRAWMDKDKDLETLRGDPRYSKLAAKLEKRSGEEKEEGDKAGPVAGKKGKNKAAKRAAR